LLVVEEVRYPARNLPKIRQTGELELSTIKEKGDRGVGHDSERLKKTLRPAHRFASGCNLSATIL
jgi:hypothetical protein